MHPLMRRLHPQMVELGLLTASRRPEVGGQQLPLTVASLASAYLMAANLSADDMELFSIIAVAWRWLAQAAAAREGLARGSGGRDFYEGKLCAAQYWFATEVPRVPHLVELCRSGEDSYTRMRPDWF